jgi:DNA-binding XRE family transcriptional regulator
MDQTTLASAAKVSPNTISAMEKKGAESLTSGLDTIQAITRALKAAGVELLNDGQPGARRTK